MRKDKRQIISKYSRYGIKNFRDLFKLVEDDVLSDVDIHDDLVRLDYLEAEKKYLSS